MVAGTMLNTVGSKYPMRPPTTRYRYPDTQVTLEMRYGSVMEWRSPLMTETMTSIMITVQFDMAVDSGTTTVCTVV